MLRIRLLRLFASFTALASLLAACASAPATPPAGVQSTPARTPAAAPTAMPTVAPTSAPTPRPTTASTAVPTLTPQPTATPNPIADPITGAPALARGAVRQRPHVVMIDNHPDAYPQTGLDHAALVFEALAEFGVTRFMAVYVPGITPNAATIGPVRSTRLYFAQWVQAFQAIYAHAGGSPQGLAFVESNNQIVNLDALHPGGVPYFWRDHNRVAPHNLYTSSAELDRAAEERGVASFEDPAIGFLFKTDTPENLRPDAQQFSYFFIYRQDLAGWEYDPQTNGYFRLRRGRPAVDATSGEQLWTKNVVVMEVEERPIPGDPKARIEQMVIGEGRALIFMDGVIREASWRKDSPAAQLGFYDPSGDEVRLNAGPVWIVALPSLDNLTVQ